MKSNVFFLRTVTAIALIVLGTFLYTLSSIFTTFFLIALFIFIALYELPALAQQRAFNYIVLLLYVGIPLLLFNILFCDPVAHHLALFIVGWCSLNDTSAYVGGSLWGVHKLMPKVSPGKTWEGFFVGLVITEFFTALFLWWQGLFPPYWFLYGVLVVSVANASDLFESWLKRRAHCKDSSSFLPGHGGVLDRIDSMLGVTILVWLTRAYLVTWYK